MPMIGVKRMQSIRYNPLTSQCLSFTTNGIRIKLIIKLRNIIIALSFIYRKFKQLILTVQIFSHVFSQKLFRRSFARLIFSIAVFTLSVLIFTKYSWSKTNSKRVPLSTCLRLKSPIVIMSRPMRKSMLA